jgi:NADH-quinone oxidoreductase subunit M
MLWLYQRVFYGETPEAVTSHVYDLVRREWAAIVPLIALMVWMGVYTPSFLPPITRTNAAILEQSKMNVKFRVAAPPLMPTLSAKEVRDGR